MTPQGPPQELPTVPTLGTAFARGGNNLGLLRLGAALLVLFSHSFVLAGHPEAEPVALLFRHFIDGGGLAVAAFFVLSGFLIARSAERRSLTGYVWARVLRIYPAYLVLVAVQTFGVGLLMTRLPAAAYLADRATWVAVLRAVPFSPSPGLPGVFEGNPLPLEVNGSVWTLRIEVLCYAGLELLAPWMLRRGGALAAVACGFAVLGGVSGMGPRIGAVADCGLHFVVGAALWCWKDHVRVRGRAMAVAAVAVLAAPGTIMAPLVWHAAFPYLVLAAGLTRPVAERFMRRLGDVSYGTYLFAFPLQQCVAAVLPGVSPPGLAALALPPTLLCAFLSNRLVERPVLRWKRG